MAAYNRIIVIGKLARDSKIRWVDGRVKPGGEVASA